MKSPLSQSFLPAHSSLRFVGVDRFCLLLNGWGLKVLSLLLVVMVGGMSWGQTNPTAQSLPYSQNFGTSTFTSMPAGMAAWTAGGNRTTQATAEGALPGVDAAITLATASQTSGAIYGYAVSSNARAYIQQSSNATNGTNTIAVAINTGAGVTSINLSYQLELINGGATTQDFGLALQYRAGTSGAWTTVSGSVITFGAVTTYTTSTQNYTISGLTANTAYQIRWITWRPSGSGSSKGIGIDNISVSAASATPTINTSGTISALTTTYGSVSSNTTFSVSGSNMSAGISVSPPAGFEVSTVSDFSSNVGTNGSPITVGAAGTIASTTVYVRLAASTVVGTYSGNIVLSSSGASSVNVATVSSTVAKRVLTITAVNQTVSYGTGTATVTGAGTYTVSGFVNSENSTVISGSVTYTSNFTSTTNAGTNVATITPVVSGLNATNYSFTAANGNISVTALQLMAPTNLSISGGNNSLSISFSDPSNSTSTGSIISNYKYSLDGGTTFQAFSPAQTISPLIISALTNNTTYDVQILAVNSYGNGVASATVQGTPVPVPTINTSASLTAFTTTYGTASTSQSFAISGTNLTGDITATAPTGYEVSNGGTSYSSTATFAQTSGTATGTLYVRLSATASVSSNYNSLSIVFSSPGATNVNVGTSSSGNSISAKNISISGITISNKVYDGNNSASITGTAEYTGLANSQTFTVSGTPTAVFINKNVENGKAVTVSGYSAPNSNYVIIQPNGLTANITTLTITLTNPLVSSKTYNGTTSATISGTLNGIISPDIVNLVGDGAYATANAGSNIVVTASSTLSGADAGNYSLTQPTGLTGEITQKALIVTANNVTKEAGVQVTGGSGSTSFTSNGLVGSETIGSVTITYGDAAGTTGNGATQGTYTGQVTPSLATGGTFNSSNYSITYNSGNIIVSGFTAGNLIVERIGDGSTTIASTASQINLLEFTPSLSLTQTINDLFTSPNLLTESGTGTSAGQLNSYGAYLAVPGYNTNLSTAGVSTSNTKATNILSTNAGLSNRIVFPTSGTVPFDGGSFRSIIPISNNTGYVSGTAASGSSSGGIWYYYGSNYTQINATITNTRNVEIFNGNLYFSTGSGIQGVYQLANGLPITSGQLATLIAGTTSPYGFSISPDGKTMYIADDGSVSSNTGGGIQKWSFNGTNWSRVYTFTNAGSARGITVDYSGEYAVIYATSTEVSSINSIKKIVDNGSTSTPTSISSNTKYVFRGIDFAPAPLPSAPTIGTVTQTTCASSTGSVELTGLPSGQWRIYGFPSGSAFGTGTSTTISGLSAGSYTFVVTSYTGRTSAATASVTINTQPGVPGYPSAPSATASQMFCSGATINDLSATGTSIQWYNASSGGSTYASSTALNSAHYYATQTVSGCESTNRTDVTSTVNALPSAPTANNASRCGTGTVSISATPSTNETIDWYDSATGGAALASGSSSSTLTFTTPSISSTTIYYAEARNLTTGCTSATRTAVTVTVNANNTASVASSTPTLCISTPLTGITHTTTGATGIGSPTGLPSGVSAAWASNTITISGTPTSVGTFTYSIPLTGGCGSAYATGTITVVDAYTWTGAVSSAWSEANNWSPNGVPTSAYNVNINSVSSPYYQLEELSALTINQYSTFTLKANAKLSLSGIITNNGNFTIENGATLVQTGAGINSGGGAYNVKQTITGAGSGTPTGRYWYVGSPVSGATSAVYNASGANVLKYYSEPANAWQEITDNTSALEVGRGYFVQAASGTTELNFTGGTINNGDYTLNVTRNTTTNAFRGYNLLTNPYPSYLDWDNVTRSNVGATIWYRSVNNAGTMVFDTYNAPGGTGTNNNQAGAVTRYIPPMQSFWVSVPQGQTSGTVSFGNAQRSHFIDLATNGYNGLRSSAQDFPAFLRLNLLDGNFVDQTILYMKPDANNTFDEYDSEKMFLGGVPQFYSTVNAKKLVLNGMKNQKVRTSVPLTMELPTSKSYTFQAEEFNIEDGLILLEDKQEGVIQDLTINPTYSFFGNAGTNATRFVVHFQLANAPVLVGGPLEFESLGSEDLTTDNIQIFSNNQGTVVIRLDEGFKPEGSIQIFDASGRLVEQTDLNDQETTIQLNEQTGMYFVEVAAGKLMVKKKIVIQ